MGEDNANVDEIFKDLDKIDEELGIKPEAKTDDDPKGTELQSTVDSLTEKLEAASKEKQGLMNAAKSERRKRQEMKGSLDSLTSTVNSIIQQRQAGKKDDLNDVGMLVDFSEDGEKAYIPNKELDDMLNPLYQKIEQLESTIRMTAGAAEGNRQAKDTMDSIVGSDERYGSVYGKYRAARNWVENQVIDFQRDNNINRVVSSGQALDKIFTEDMEKEFKEKYPEFSLVDVVTAEDSQRHFSNMLSNTADTFDSLMNNDKSQKPVDSSKFKQIINKPLGLSSATNAKGSELTVSEKVGQLNSTDIMDLSDAQASQLEEALLREERADGVKF